MRYWIFAALLATASAAAAAPPPAAPAPLALSTAPDGSLELRAGKNLVARIPVKTPALRRGQPALRDLDVDGHRVAEVRLPVRGTAA